jgi:hypothetical protein
MKKLVLCLVAATLYLNPLYPVYAIEGSNTAPKPLGPTTAIKRMEDNREKLSSKEAELRMKMEDKREKLASRAGELKEKMASRAALLKEKLAQFKDQVKAQRAEKVSETLQTINANRTKMMTTHLENLTKILNTIEDRVNEGGSSGKNVDSAKSAISSARSAIEKASAAVSAQSTKDYEITVNSEATVKTDAKNTRDSLMTDLKSTHELVKEAREAVVNALKAAKEALGVV